MNPVFQYKNFNSIVINNGRVEVPYQKKWNHKGHSIDKGWVSLDGRFFYINIPKNNSSFVKKILGEELNWNYGSIEDYPDARPLVVFRNPVDRWISGITEYLFMYHINTLDRAGYYSKEFGYKGLLGSPLAIDLILQNVTFDDHTEKQVKFLQGVTDLSKVIWFESNQDFSANFNNFLVDSGLHTKQQESLVGQKLVNSDNSDTNDNEYQESFKRRRRAMKDFWREYLNAHPGWIDSINNHYAADNYLYESVKFYGQRRFNK